MSGGPRRRFGNFEVDLSWGRLYRDGRPIGLQPQPVRVLAALIERAGEIVSRDELKARIWDQATFVEFDQGLNYCIRQIRVALGDDASKPAYLETIKGHGYRFLSPVEAEADSAPGRPASTASHPSIPLSRWPAMLDPLLGREKDLVRVEALLDEHSIVTLTGPGGVGKTRLALEIGRQHKRKTGDGAYWIDLTRATQEDDVLALCAEVLGLADTDARPLLDRVLEWLRDREALLIFDNFEHVLMAAPLLPEICASAATASILVTSRASLSVRGEHEYRVPPLRWTGDDAHDATAAAEPPAVRLFFDRLSARDGTHVEVIDPRDVSALCERLDGLPLAIELAAARASVLAVPELVSRERIVGVLSEAPRGMPPRQQSLRRTIEWSYGLLGSHEQAALRALAVFIGGFTTEAAVQVLTTAGVITDEGAALDAVATLHEHSFLSVVRVSTFSVRLRLLETVREFCLDATTSEDLAGTRVAHAGYVRLLFEREGPRLRTDRDVESMERLFDDEANLRAALRWALDVGSTTELVGLAAAASWFWHTANLFVEGRRWTLRAIEAARVSPEVSDQARCAVLAAGALMAFHTIEFEATASLIDEITAAPADPFASTLAACLRGGLLAYDGRQEEAESAIADARDRSRALQQPWLEALAGLVGGHAASIAGQHEAAYDRLRRAPRGVGFLDYWLDLTLALEALTLNRLDEAVRSIRPVLRQRYGSYQPIRQLAGAFEAFGYVCDRRSEPETAALLLATADRRRRETASPLFKVWLPEHDRAMASVRRGVGARFDEVWARGAALTLDDGIALAEAVVENQ